MTAGVKLLLEHRVLLSAKSQGTEREEETWGARRTRPLVP